VVWGQIHISFLWAWLGPVSLHLYHTVVGLVVEAASTATTLFCTAPISLVMDSVVVWSHLVGLGLVVVLGLEPKQIGRPVCVFKSWGYQLN